MDAQELYTRLGHHYSSMPEDLSGPYPVSTNSQLWLGRAFALVNEVGQVADIIAMREAFNGYNKGLLFGQDMLSKEISSIMVRSLGLAELRAPLISQGAFIPVGNAFDAQVAIGNILATATADLLIVDPYLDEKALTDFALLAAAKVSVRLLGDEKDHKASLKPAAQRWTTQYKTERPLEVRLSPARVLHDRLIIADGNSVWVLTQSLKDFAARSPASLVRADAELSARKVSAYSDLWQQAAVLN